MEQELKYDGEVIKGDLIEIYCKTMVNLGPLNVLFSKDFGYSGKWSKNRGRGGMAGFNLAGYARPLIGYVARHLMDSWDPAQRCSMERSLLTIGGPFRRSIEMENTDEGIKVKVEGSALAVKRMKKTLDKILIRYTV